MTRHIEKHKRIWASILAIVVAACTFLGALYLNPFSADAFYDTDAAITFGEFNSKHPVSEKYFFVGTYLFPLDVISDEIYENAISSQSAMNQYNNYYKSELAGGIWFDISDASDLSNITVNGTKVDEEVLNKLYVTVFIDENGKVFDAKTMASMSLYDTPDPYDLSKIPELETLYTQYKSMFSDESTGINLYYYENLRTFFITDLRQHDESLKKETDRLDKILKNLQKAYDSLMDESKTEEAEEVQKVMKRVDNARRALIYKRLAVEGRNSTDEYELSKLNLLLSNQSKRGSYDIEAEDEIEQSTMPYDIWTNNNREYTYDQLYEYIKNHDGLAKTSDDDDGVTVVPDFEAYFSGTDFDGARSTKQEFKQVDAIISTLYDADAACKSKYDQLTSESVATPDSHLGKLIYDCEEAIFAEAENGYSSKMSSMIEELVILNNISSNAVVDKENELSKVKNNLLPDCENGFKSVATGGVGEGYSIAASQGANDDGLTSALEARTSLLNKEMTELEFAITAYRMRVTPRECFQATLGWIDQTDALTTRVVEDEFASNARIGINSHKAWLTDLLEQLVKEDESLQSELDKLKAQKEALNAAKMKALDDNDLNALKKIEEQLKEIDRLIDEEVAKAQNSSENGSASASERAMAEVALQGTSAAAANSIRDDALNKLRNGEDASEEIAALEALGATDALNEVKGKGKGSGAGSGSGSGSGNGSGSGSGTGAGSGSGSGAGSGAGSGSGSGKGIANLSENELRNLIESVLGGPFEKLSPSGKVVAAVGLEWAGDAGNQVAKALAKNFIEICANEKNIYVYDTHLDGANAFARLDTIGKVTDYRYVYGNAGKTGTLAKGTHSYSFEKDSNVMTIDGTDADAKMDSSAVLRFGALYISGKTAKENFGLSAEAVKNSQYSAVLNSKMESQAKKLLDAFKNGGTN